MCSPLPQGLTAPYAGHFCVAAGDVFDHPTFSPTVSAFPTLAPTPAPTSLPSPLPSMSPTSIPLSAPSRVPTSMPTVSPTRSPSAAPSRVPTSMPTASPTSHPTMHPTPIPTPMTPLPTPFTPLPTPTPLPTSLPTPTPTPLPTPLPTPNPTRTPMVVLSIGLAGITCDDYNQSVFFSALDEYLSNATFHESACSDVSRRRAQQRFGSARDGAERRLDATTGVDIVTQLSMPKSFETDDCSTMCIVIDTMQGPVASGNFTVTLKDYAVRSRRRQLTTPNSADEAARRLGASSGGMGGASAESMSVDTFAPSPAPSPLPSPLPSPAPSTAPTPLPTPAPSALPTTFVEFSAVAVLGMSGLWCDEFGSDETSALALAFSDVLDSSATISTGDCTDDSGRRLDLVRRLLDSDASASVAVSIIAAAHQTGASSAGGFASLLDDQLSAAVDDGSLGSAIAARVGNASSLASVVVTGITVSTQAPTPSPSPLPTAMPTVSPRPSPLPSSVPIPLPSPPPSALPAPAPTNLPTGVPTPVPTQVPTFEPTDVPLPAPTPMPTDGGCTDGRMNGDERSVARGVRPLPPAPPTAHQNPPPRA